VRRAWILVYEHPSGTSVARMNRLRNRLFGYTDRSNRGRYEYQRPGLLTGRPFLRLKRGVVALPLDLGEAARLLVVEEEAWAWLRKVELLPDDGREMGRSVGARAPIRKQGRKARKTSRKRR
jgi:hypothetical protein